ncbi:hypothetical protein TNCV_216701 [Trichonephila clavipes]|nr:hypothetical protein TNCV_216701 [Trichonephila clavipes]
MPLEFKRLQFPVRLAFAMTINKAQRTIVTSMWIKFGGVHASPHGQLMWLARVGKSSDLFVYAPDGKNKNIIVSPQHFNKHLI